jgi:ABC-type bacteriocin/lantibiotic exporter with double-glycine peptidase domain
VPAVRQKLHLSPCADFPDQLSYLKQADDWSCGAACLEMVYRFYGLTGVSQRHIYNQRRTPDPHKGGKYQITTDSMIADAIARGFDARWFRINLTSAADMDAQIATFLDRKIPLIACQRLSNDKPLLGHFRIITDRDGSFIYAHDPAINGGGAHQRKAIAAFLEFWKPTGVNVTGGVAIEIMKRSATSSATGASGGNSKPK